MKRSAFLKRSAAAVALLSGARFADAVPEAPVALSVASEAPPMLPALSRLPEALTASGGFCEPLMPFYPIHAFVDHGPVIPFEPFTAPRGTLVFTSRGEA